MSAQQDRDGAQLRVGDEPLWAAWHVNTAWRGAWLRAVAKAWVDPTFKAQLVADPARALRELGFDYPEFLRERLQLVVVDHADRVDLSIEGADPARPAQQLVLEAAEGREYRDNHAPIQGQQVNGWREFGEDLRQTLILRLPPKPKDGLAPIALADYEAAGRVYPLTIC